jgi:hypothetical protein
MENADNFSVEAKSQSTNRLFLRRVKSKSHAFDDVKAMRSVKKKSLSCSKSRATSRFPGKDLAIWPIPTALKNVYCLLQMELIIPP